MTSQFSPKVSEILAFSREEANRLASRWVGPEHLLLGIIREKNETIEGLFNKLNVSIPSVKSELEERISQAEANEPIKTSELVLNDKASNILKLAVLEARTQHTQTVDVPHLLLAILHDSVSNGAKEVLEFNNVEYEDAVGYLYNQSAPAQNGLTLPAEDEEENISNDSRPSNIGGQSANSSAQPTTSTRTPGNNGHAGKTPVLDNFSTDLTKAAAEGKLDPVVGREKEILRLEEILCRRKKNNPVLIGEPGVGKSAIVEGLAQLIADHRTSPILFNKRLVSLDLTGLVAGTKYRGQFEERVKTLIKELEDNPQIIIFIDEIHTMIGAGSTPGSMDAANIMKPALARGVVQCIGATTLDEYRNSIEKDGALERRFQKIIVDPTTAAETLLILNNIKDRYEAHHHVTYTDEALQACVKYTDRYVTDRHFPDKAIDALDEVGSKVHLRHAQVPPEIIQKEAELNEVKAQKREAVSSQNYEMAANCRDRQTEIETELKQLNEQWANGATGDRKIIGEADVAEVVSMMTGVPVQRMAEAESVKLKNMAGELKHSVIAQDSAIDKMVKAIQRNRVGLRAPNHPIGAFMFLGPTGVGKTYLAKKLAESMFGSQDALIRIDMSEYTEGFNVSRLVGAPPGYVGYEEGGQLTEKVRRKPYSIVLLDEIEKANSAVFNLLLQVLDEGRLTDGLGRLVDFRNTVIIMTSNAGTRQLKDFGHGIGFSAAQHTDDLSHSEADKQRARAIVQKSLKDTFAPEFLNRLDEIITFDQLDLKAITKIIDLELAGLFKRIADLGYSVQITDKAKEFVARKGYDVQFGARPLKRAIQNYIEDGICAMIIDEKLSAGDTISIGKNSSKEELTFTAKSASQEQE
jgi:ATP-dependent Clp protease ATP-binding subunit ClpC